MDRGDPSQGLRRADQGRAGDETEVPPCREAAAEADFGRLGLVWDPATGRRRLAWALLVVLVYSRHCFVWPLFQQRLEEVIEGLEAAWAFFGGIPRSLIVDNFPAAVVGPDPLAPRLTRGFLEYSQRRGFLADPPRPRHPKDKPHVERGVPYVRERFFKGGQFHDLADLREQARRGPGTQFITSLTRLSLSTLLPSSRRVCPSLVSRFTTFMPTPPFLRPKSLRRPGPRGDTSLQG